MLTKPHNQFHFQLQYLLVLNGKEVLFWLFGCFLFFFFIFSNLLCTFHPAEHLKFAILPIKSNVDFLYNSIALDQELSWTVRFFLFPSESQNHEMISQFLSATTDNLGLCLSQQINHTSESRKK